jgi:hypothetical protein
VVNDLAQQASCFRSNQGKLYILEKSDVLIYHSGCSGLHSMHNTKIYFVEPSLAKPDVLESETRGSDISRGSDDLGETTTAGLDDWRAPLIRYLENPDHVIDRKVWWQTLKNVLLDHDLYR